MRTHRLALALCWLASWWPGWTVAGAPILLARIDGPPAAVLETLPVYACLQDVKGTEYVLAFADQAALDRAGRAGSVLQTNAQPADFVLARYRRAGWRALPVPGLVVADDGRNLLIRASREEREALSGLGFELMALPERPIPAAARDAQGRAFARMALAPVSFDSRVAEMIQQVKTTNLYALVSQWSGESPAVTGGDLYDVRTRYTTNQVATAKSSQLAFQHLQALGLAAGLHHWNASVYSNRNVVAVLPGGALSNEIVLVVAHLDCTAPSPRARAPGADDNASGSAAVVVAADLMRRFRFDRTIRFVIFTGEEQGLYGSARYASLCSAAGDNIVAVLNMDMIGWDSGGGPVASLHTRTSGNAGYAGDRAIAATFTNVVATYGLGASLAPAIIADSDSASDHSSFWNVGYPAIMAIEDDNDFLPYYHTTNDTLAHLNLPYFTAFTKAAVGTAAHLAQVADRVPFDVIQVDSSDWTPGSGIGVGTFYARHESAATESGADARDLAWSSAPTNPYGRWLRVHTAPYGTALATDARPITSETVFQGQLTAITTSAAPFSCTNRLRFTHLSALESNRAYTVRVQVDGRYAANSNSFQCVTNLRQLVAGGGFISLPLLTNLTNGAVYGTCDIGSRLQDQSPTSCPLAVVSNTGGHLTFTLPVQVGFPVVDVLETSTNLLDPAGWRAALVATSSVPVTADNFDGGWGQAERSAAPAQTNVPGASFRLRRQWLAP